MLSPVQIEEHLGNIARDGYTIVRDAIEPDLVDALNDDLLRLERDLGIKPAGNLFEGSKTIRIYNLLAHGPNFTRIPVHENLLPIVEKVLDAGCLVSSLSSVSIDPGETAQPLHTDDQLIHLDRPHDAIVCNSMWALSDFTEENGATRVVPGSHQWDQYPDFGPGQTYESVPAVMPKGSIMIWNGSIWHGGGANRSNERRVGIAMNYCAGFIRQQENQQLGIPREIVATFPKRLKELVGYGVYRDLMGHIDKKSPMDLVGEEAAIRTVWDR